MKFPHLVLLLFMFLIACEDSTQIVENPNELLPETVLSSEDFNDRLLLSASHLFVELNKSDQDDVNQIISPLSIQVAMALLVNGAQANTRDEIKTFLQLSDESIGGINAHFDDLFQSITSANKDNSSLTVSNAAIWNPGMMTMDTDYLERIKGFYNADCHEDRFTVEGINAWAEEATDGLIEEVLQEIKEDEVLFLLNALLYKGDWLSGFDEGYTFDYTTELPDGSQVTFPMMSSDYLYNYFDNGEVQAVNLPFQGEEYEMVFVQPKTEELDQFIASKGGQGIADLFQTLHPDAFTEDRIMLQVPKFEVEYKRNISETLQDLGIVDAFDDSAAKLDGLGTAPGNLFVTRVLHDTYFKVDEKGVEGAAVTTVGVGVESIPPVFTFDSPFIICLRKTDSQTPIFMGKIGDPSKD